jgi:DNA-binding NtrC family response regulator
MNTAKTVLIVDDEPHVRLVFQIALESAGYTVVAAADGKEALARVREAPLDLILLDLKMPVLDGMETLRRLHEQGNRLPVVIITAHGSVADAVAAMKQGAIDFVPKPVSPTTLREVVARAVAGAVPPAQHQQPAGHTPVPQPSLLCTEDLARARRALERSDFDDAEFFLRVAEALDPGSSEVPRIRSELNTRRSAPEAMRFRIVGEWSS